MRFCLPLAVGQLFPEEENGREAETRSAADRIKICNSSASQQTQHKSFCASDSRHTLCGENTCAFVGRHCCHLIWDWMTEFDIVTWPAMGKQTLTNVHINGHFQWSTVTLKYRSSTVPVQTYSCRGGECFFFFFCCAEYLVSFRWINRPFCESEVIIKHCYAGQFFWAVFCS